MWGRAEETQGKMALPDPRSWFHWMVLEPQWGLLGRSCNPRQMQLLPEVFIKLEWEGENLWFPVCLVLQSSVSTSHWTNLSGSQEDKRSGNHQPWGTDRAGGMWRMDLRTKSDEGQTPVVLWGNFWFFLGWSRVRKILEKSGPLPRRTVGRCNLVESSRDRYRGKSCMEAQGPLSEGRFLDSPPNPTLNPNYFICYYYYLLFFLLQQWSTSAFCTQWKSV